MICGLVSDLPAIQDHDEPRLDELGKVQIVSKKP